MPPRTFLSCFFQIGLPTITIFVKRRTVLILFRILLKTARIFPFPLRRILPLKTDYEEIFKV